MTNDTSSSPQPLHEKRPIPRGDQKAATLVPSAVAHLSISISAALFFSAFGDENA
jgi:hypothetical protein